MLTKVVLKRKKTEMSEDPHNRRKITIGVKFSHNGSTHQNRS